MTHTQAPTCSFYHISYGHSSSDIRVYIDALVAAFPCLLPWRLPTHTEGQLQGGTTDGHCVHIAQRKKCRRSNMVRQASKSSIPSTQYLIYPGPISWQRTSSSVASTKGSM